MKNQILAFGLALVAMVVGCGGDKPLAPTSDGDGAVVVKVGVQREGNLSLALPLPQEVLRSAKMAGLQQVGGGGEGSTSDEPTTTTPTLGGGYQLKVAVEVVEMDYSQSQWIALSVDSDGVAKGSATVRAGNIQLSLTGEKFYRDEYGNTQGQVVFTAKPIVLVVENGKAYDVEFELEPLINLGFSAPIPSSVPTETVMVSGGSIPTLKIAPVYDGGNSEVFPGSYATLVEFYASMDDSTVLTKDIQVSMNADDYQAVSQLQVFVVFSEEFSAQVGVTGLDPFSPFDRTVSIPFSYRFANEQPVKISIRGWISPTAKVGYAFGISVLGISTDSAVNLEMKEGPFGRYIQVSSPPPIAVPMEIK